MDNDIDFKLKEHLRDFDSEHLHKLMIMYYDHWTWVSGDDDDQHFIELINGILAERGESSPIIVEEQGVTLSCDELRIKKLSDPYSYTLFQFDGSQLSIGYDLKVQLVNMLSNEIKYGMDYGNGSLKDVIINAVDTSYRIANSFSEDKIDRLEKRLAELEAKHENRN